MDGWRPESWADVKNKSLSEHKKKNRRGQHPFQVNAEEQKETKGRKKIIHYIVEFEEKTEKTKSRILRWLKNTNK